MTCVFRDCLTDFLADKCDLELGVERTDKNLDFFLNADKTALLDETF